MKKTVLRPYAKLHCRLRRQHSEGAGGLRPGQELDQPEFVTMLVEECYKLKAKKVVVDWSHQPIDKLHRALPQLDHNVEAR